MLKKAVLTALASLLIATTAHAGTYYLKGISVSADSKDDLETAKRFYEASGYTHCERYNDNPQATIFMRRQL